MQLFKEVGNDRANELYEYNLESHLRIDPNCDMYAVVSRD